MALKDVGPQETQEGVVLGGKWNRELDLELKVIRHRRVAMEKEKECLKVEFGEEA